MATYTYNQTDTQSSIGTAWKTSGTSYTISSDQNTHIASTGGTLGSTVNQATASPQTSFLCVQFEITPGVGDWKAGTISAPLNVTIAGMNYDNPRFYVDCVPADNSAVRANMFASTSFPAWTGASTGLKTANVSTLAVPSAQATDKMVISGIYFNNNTMSITTMGWIPDQVITVTSIFDVTSTPITGSESTAITVTESSSIVKQITATDGAAITAGENVSTPMTIDVSPLTSIADDFTSALPDGVFKVGSYDGTIPATSGGNLVITYDTAAGSYKDVSTFPKRYTLDTTGVTVEIAKWPTLMYGADDFGAQINAWGTTQQVAFNGASWMVYSGAIQVAAPANVRYINYKLNVTSLEIRLYDALGAQTGVTVTQTPGNWLPTDTMLFWIQYAPNGSTDTFEIARVFSGAPPVTTIKTASDSAAITIADASAIVKGITASDGAAITASDASGTMVKSTTTTDGAAVTIVETATIFRALTATDGAAITIAEAAGQLSITKTATDGAAISIADSGSKSVLSSFSPEQITGLIGWYSADAQPVRADGAAMPQLFDISGNNNHGIATQSPNYRTTAGPSGGPAFTFNGGHYFTLPNLMNGLAAGEILSTIKSTDDSSAGLWHFGTNGQNTHYKWAGDVIDDFGSTTRQQFTTGATDTKLWHRYNVYSANNDWSAYLDGTQVGVSFSTTVAWRTNPTIGSEFGGTGTISHGVILIYNRKLTTQERSDVNTWIAANPSGGTNPSVTTKFKGAAETTSIAANEIFANPNPTIAYNFKQGKALDLSGNGRNAVSVNGYANIGNHQGHEGAVWFPGPSDRLEAPGFDLTNVSTIRFDMNMSGFSGIQTLVALRGPVGESENIMQIRFDGGGNAIHHVFWDSSGNATNNYSNAGSFSTATWYTIHLVRNGTSVTTYINGTSVGTTTTTATARALQSGTKFTIGGNASNAEYISDGSLIDSVAIWAGTAFTQAQVTADLADITGSAISTINPPTPIPGADSLGIGVTERAEVSITTNTLSIINGDFETGTTFGWTQYPNNNIFSIGSTNASGSYALQITNTDNNANYAYSNYFPVTPGKCYRAKARVSARGNAILGIDFFNASYVSVGGGPVMVPDYSGGSMINLTSDAVAPAGAVYGRVRTMAVSMIAGFSDYQTISQVDNVSIAEYAQIGVRTVSDNFYGGDAPDSLHGRIPQVGGVGTWWTTNPSNWGISGGQAYASSTSPGGRAWLDTGLVDGSFQVEFTAGASISDYAQVLNFRGSQNGQDYISLYQDGTKVRFNRFFGGVEASSSGDINGVIAVGQTTTFRVDCKGANVKVYANNVLVFTYTITDPSLLTGTLAGFGSAVRTDNRWDNFLATGPQLVSAVETFDAGIPADVVKGSAIVYEAGTGNPGGAIRGTGGPNDWWYFTDPKWAVTGDFDLTQDIYINGSTREILNLAFWITNPGATADGYMWRMDSSGGGGTGPYVVNGGSHSGLSVGGWTPPGSIPTDTWYRVRLVGVASTGALTVTITKISDSSVLYSASGSLGVGPTRSGTFGRKHDGLAGPGSVQDNITLTAASPTGGTDSTSIAVSESATVLDMMTAKSATDTAAITITDASVAPMAKTSTATDTTAITIAETSAVFKTMVATDQAAVSIAETRLQTATFSAVDGAAVSVAESVAFGPIFLAATDTTAISVADLSFVNQGNAPVGNESTAITIADSVALLAKTGMQVVDGAAISIAETSGIFFALSAVDGAAVSVAETRTPAVQISTVDSASISIAEARTIDRPLSATDTTAITIADASTSFRTLSATDGASISVAEVSFTSISKSATDGGSIAVAESSSKSVAVAPENEVELNVTDPAPVQVIATHIGIIMVTTTQAAPDSITVTEVYA